MRIAVLGGGIAGLAAAHRCREIAQEQNTPLDLTVIERSHRVGGCIETLRADGFVMEMGPDSLLTEKPAAIQLIEKLGLSQEIVSMRPEFRGARIVRGGRLVAIPDDFRLFTPTSLGSLLTSRLFTPFGAIRAAAEPLIPAKTGDEDESLAAFVTRRFGREVLDRLAQPLIGGIYSGDPKRLSVGATMPRLLEMERKYGSLTRGMRAAMRAPKNGSGFSPLVSLREGLGMLPLALERTLAATIRTNSEVVDLMRIHDASGATTWMIKLGDGSHVVADALICALPAHGAARIFEGAEPRLAQLLRRIRYHSIATVTMAFDTASVPAMPRATGFVVPNIEHRNILATTFSSQKYPGRAPDGALLLRAFVGGALTPELMTLRDEQLIDAVFAEFRELLGIHSLPRFFKVRRWNAALPEYELGHGALVTRIDDSLRATPDLALAGSAYNGAGIPDCIRSGRQAADQLVGATQGCNLPL